MIERLRGSAPRRSSESIYDPERDGSIEVEGDPKVIQVLIQQAENVREGKEDPDIRVALFILPGGIRGVSGGAEVTAINDEGLTDGIKVVVGGSTGAHIGAWLLEGNPRLGTSIFSEECTTKDFIRTKRIIDGYGMDVEYLSQVYRGEAGNKRLDTERIKNAKPDFLIAATEYETGKGVLLDGKTEPIIDKIQASSAAGPLYTEPLYIDDVRYGDASAGAYFPVREILDRYHPTHILVLTNRPKSVKDSLSSQVADRALSSLSLPSSYRKAWLSREQNYAAGRRLLDESGIPYLIVYPDNAVQSLTQDAEKIHATAVRAEDHMRKLIDSEKATDSNP